MVQPQNYFGPIHVQNLTETPFLYFRYNNGPQQQGPPSAAGPPPQTLLQQQQQQRYGSQTSLQPPPPHTPQPRVSNDVSPMIYHATPRIVGTPQSSAGGGGPPQRLVSIGSANLTPTGPEKPQRTYEDNNNKPRSISQGNPPRGVRFQDPNDDKVSAKTLGILETSTFDINLVSGSAYMPPVVLGFLHKTH